MNPKPEHFILGFLLLAIGFVVIYPHTDVVSGLSTNSTLLLTLLTAAYVILTFLLIRSSRLAMEEEHRPFVVATLPLEGFHIYCCIENSGDRPAHELTVSFDPSLEVLSPDGAFKGTSAPLLFQSFLPPHFKFRSLISTTIHALNVPKERKLFSVTVSYSGPDGKKYSDSYRIDLNSYVFVEKRVEPDIPNHLAFVVNKLSEIKEVLEKSTQPPAPNKRHTGARTLDKRRKSKVGKA